MLDYNNRDKAAINGHSVNLGSFSELKAVISFACLKQYFYELIN
jgi:hypothetical protein